MGKAFLGHTNTYIFNHRLTHGIARPMGGKLRKIHGNFSAGERVFQKIAQNVQEDLPQLCIITKNIRMDHPVIHCKFNYFFFYLKMK